MTTAMHAYPSDLARHVHEALADEEHVATRPPLHVLERVLSACYQASLLRDEERPISFRVLFVEPSAVDEHGGPPHGLHRLRFVEPREFDEEELRRLAPAAKLHRSLIGAHVVGEKACIWGILHSGPGWLRAVSGGRGVETPGPDALTVMVTSPGRLIVTHGGMMLGRLSAGSLSTPGREVFDATWVAELFREARSELIDMHLAARAASNESWAELHPDLPRLIAQHFVRRAIATIRVARHGGTILFVSSQGEDALRALNIKHRFVDDEPRRRFRTLIIEAMNALAASAPPDRGVGWNEYTLSTDRRILALDEAIFEIAHMLAAFADIDGAVVVTDRFEIVGFGAEISSELAAVTHVHRALDLEGLTFHRERVDGVGTRHRSVYRLCMADPTVLAIVVSQDGGVRFVRMKDGAVTYWDQVSIGTLDL